MDPRILVIVGPTASGKSALGIKLAKILDAEIISADSRQVYKGLDIGTGKVTKREMQKIPHHLLDVASARRTFTASDFTKLARKAHRDILQKNKMSIVVGGTGFYIDAFLGRVSLAEVPPNKALRKKLSNLTAWELYAILKEKDPVRAETIDKNNPVRLIRAIEIADAPPAKKPLKSELVAATWIGINPQRESLRAKIHARLFARMRQGMLAEAKRLHAEGLSYKRMEDLGLEYRYLALHLQGKLSKEQMLEELEAKIWQYAKRQMTYWRRNKEIRWFSNPDEAYGHVVNMFRQK